MTEDRKSHILNASVAAFARHGFRKTSLEDVAKEAGISRQGLYLHYSSKEELFSATIHHALSRQLAAAEQALAQKPFGLALITACDEWAGTHIGMGTSDADDLAASSSNLAGAMLHQFTTRFEALLADAIASSPLMVSLAQSSLTAERVAKTIHFLITGIKTGSRTREEFRQSLTASLSVVLAPHLKEGE